MPDVRRQLAAEVRELLGQARGAARARRAATRAALAEAGGRLDRVRRAAEDVPARSGAERDRRRAGIDADHRAALHDLTARAAAAAEREAPGAAGAPWPGWRAGPGEPPGALRIGRTGPLTPVPALVPLLDRAHVVLDGADRAAADGVIATLLLRALGRAAPGALRLSGYDPERLGGGLASFAPLAGTGLLTFVGPHGLAGLLDELVEHIRRINESVLAGEYGSLRALARETGRRPEPWRVAVLLGPGGPDELSARERGQLDRIVRTGPDCGVHLVVRGLPVPDEPTVTTVAVDGGEARVSGYPGLPVLLDPPPPAELVTEACRAIAATVAAGPAPARFDDLLPAEFWTASSARELSAPVGVGPDGRPESVTLSDYPPHALIGGPSGTGKTNLIYAWLGALAARYFPAEVRFYLLDFKEGVSFARFAPRRRDPTWLPHVRLVGINVNTDREFGLALLRFLGAELRRRADAAKRHEVTSLAELRAEDPEGDWPRIVAVIDEFQILLEGFDRLAKEAADLLEDLARRGRSQGIHLVLASQEVTGIQALWGRPALVSQFTLRIALPKARKVLPESNTAAQTLPRYHAVVNADSGAIPANRIVRLPAASARESWSDLQSRLWELRPPGLTAPRLFDGDAVPDLSRAPDFRALSPAGLDPLRGAVALLGEAIDVEARSALLRLPRAPGRNLAVLGTLVAEACAVLDAAARSLARQHAPGSARFSVAALDADAADAVAALRDALPADTGWYDAAGFADLLAATAAELAVDGDDRPHYLILYAVDAASRRLADAGRKQLRTVLHDGPERRVHVLGWWRGVARLRDDLGGPASRTDPIGAWVALDVQGTELSAPWYAQAGGPPWYPRPWRGLYFDRAVHRAPDVIIPYGQP